MPTDLPKPVVHSFIPCRELFHDDRTGEYILVAPLDHKLGSSRFPTTMSLAIYGLLSEVRGTVFPVIRLVDESGSSAIDESGNLWQFPMAEPLPNDGPLQSCRLRIHDLTIPVPRAGLWDLLLLVEGDEIARYPLRFVELGPSGEELDSE